MGEKIRKIASWAGVLALAILVAALVHTITGGRRAAGAYRATIAELERELDESDRIAAAIRGANTKLGGANRRLAEDLAGADERIEALETRDRERAEALERIAATGGELGDIDGELGSELARAARFAYELSEALAQEADRGR